MISRHHEPDFSDWNVPLGQARCRVCRQLVDALAWIVTKCPGPMQTNAEGCPVVSPMAAVPDPDGERLTDGSPVGVAPSPDPRDGEREQTLDMIQRCAPHQR